MVKMRQDNSPQRIWRIVLVVSLAVNLLLIGLIGGTYVRGGGAPPRGFELQLGPLSEALSRDDRRRIGDQIRKDIGASGLSRRERREAFEALVDAVEAQPFDPERLTTLIAAQQGRTDNVRAAALGAFVNYLTDLSAQERKALAESLRERVQRIGEGGKRQPPPPRPSGG